MDAPRGNGVRQAIRPAAHRLPSSVRRQLRRGLDSLPAPVRRRIAAAGDPHAPRLGRPRWGNLRRLRPFSYDYGWDRGTPVDRLYIGAFHDTYARDVRGVCLEVLDSSYTDRYGTDVERCDVLDIDPDNALASVFADLGERDSLPRARYDCFLLTQTLHLIPEYETALQNAYDALRDGGVLLLTVPTVSPHQPAEGLEHDLWRFTPDGLRCTLERLLPGADVRVHGYGNLIACTAFLHGIVIEELDEDALVHVDPRYPLIAAARVVRGREGTRR
jgi:SAM-dependent methyltransferase